MRRIDELLALYPTRDALARKFILTELADMALSPDAEGGLDLLERESASEVALLRNQALVSLQTFLPASLRARYALIGTSAGSWTRYVQLPEMEATPAHPARSGHILSFLAAAGGLLPALIRLSREGAAAVACPAARLLARLPTPATIGVLAERAKDPGASFDDILNFAQAQSSSEDGDVLQKLLLGRIGREEGACLLLAYLPLDRALPLIGQLAPRVDLSARIDLVLALSALEAPDPGEILTRITARREPWVLVHALRLIETRGDEAAAEVLRGLYERFPVEFLRAQVLRTAGAIPGERSIELCLRGLREGSEKLRAQALESLARLRLPAERLVAEARPHVESPALRTRINAMLALAVGGVDPEELLRMIYPILKEGRVIARLEGVYALGYVRSSRAEELLSVFADHDPSEAIQSQAIRGLARLPVDHALARLAPVLRSLDVTKVKVAVQGLMRFRGREAHKISDFLEQEAVRVDVEETASVLLPALGAIGARSSSPGAPAALARALESDRPAVVAGAVKGWMLLGGAALSGTADRLRDRLGAVPPEFRPRIRQALVLAGRLDGLEGLAQDLAEDGPPAKGAVEALFDMVHLVRAPELGMRFPDLGRALGSRRDTSSTPASSPPTEKIYITRPSSQDVELDRETAVIAPISSESQQIRVADIRQMLQRPDVRARSGKEQVLEQLGKETYAVAEKMGDGRWTRGRGPMILAAVALAVAGATAWFRSPGDAVASGAAVDGKRWKVDLVSRGDLSAGGGRILAVGDPLEPGMVLDSSPKAHAGLGASGNRIVLYPGSRLKVTDITLPGGGIEVAPGRGRFWFELRSAGAVTVTVGEGRLTGGPASFFLLEEEGTRRMQVTAGKVELVRPGADGETVEAGETFELPVM